MSFCIADWIGTCFQKDSGIQFSIFSHWGFRQKRRNIKRNSGNIQISSLYSPIKPFCLLQIRLLQPLADAQERLTGPGKRILFFCAVQNRIDCLSHKPRLRSLARSG